MFCVWWDSNGIFDERFCCKYRITHVKQIVFLIKHDFCNQDAFIPSMLRWNVRYGHLHIMDLHMIVFYLYLLYLESLAHCCSSLLEAIICRPECEDLRVEERAASIVGLQETPSVYVLLVVRCQLQFLGEIPQFLTVNFPRVYIFTIIGQPIVSIPSKMFILLVSFSRMWALWCVRKHGHKSIQCSGSSHFLIPRLVLRYLFVIPRIYNCYKFLVILI